MRTIDANRRGVTILGKYEQNNTTVVRFDVRPFIEQYEGCSIILCHKRARDIIGTPVGSFEVIDSVGYWTVTKGDVLYIGKGQAELQILQGNKKRKSITYETLVVQSPTWGPAQPEQPFKSWAQKVIEASEALAGECEWDKINNKPETFPPSYHTHDADYVTYTQKETHVPGSVGEALAEALNCRVHFCEELPAVDIKLRGHFFVVFNDEGDKIYMLMMTMNGLEWVLLHDGGKPPVAVYGTAIFGKDIFS